MADDTFDPRLRGQDGPLWHPASTIAAIKPHSTKRRQPRTTRGPAAPVTIRSLETGEVIAVRGQRSIRRQKKEGGDA